MPALISPSFATIITSFHHTKSRAAINVSHSIRTRYVVDPTSQVVSSEVHSRSGVSGDVNTFNSPLFYY